MDAGLVRDGRATSTPTTQRTLSAVGSRTAPTERPRPRWREDVGAAVLLSVLNTVRDEETAATA
ncbi:hypothetical protein WCD74_18865 [Actinomycetospora sp. OC33-EN08]|uniref:Uncharacterized protein n=1 Tax=Actinomycetospora aurantiaca TaxID=3129233 RepID=A0ABU8MRA2_9PSEU